MNIERQPEGEYMVSVPVSPGCYTEGRTFEEAREMAADAIQANRASLLKQEAGLPIQECLLSRDQASRVRSLAWISRRQRSGSSHL
ncbi:MAG: type II toxin-antitoxin system HicB family antitoxin [Anaerolineae bacterium]|jgi:predicted RNase H-like HicB family nuclease